MWNGVDYGPQADRITTGEALFVEREIGIDTEHWSMLVQLMVEAFWTVRRKDPDAIQWADVEALPIDALDALFVDDAPARKAPQDRKPPTAAKKAAARKASSDPLAGGSTGSGASRRTRGTRRGAAGSSSSASPSTSST
jgi:hypothetical protein